ncbi:spondin domain-containing protein [Alteromonas oceanisediminis]|uniref:spondin domain-containing protein n=1 Tax=Alteromonas oceanisediminis TaxID=2836180 RepID=UPI001BDAD1A4|nr:spondin domain-containing protein [Alteromonas oceanisediminis]MBT0585999.1 spondin domain-containing protein [Alteromonas oceanisediminis]
MKQIRSLLAIATLSAMSTASNAADLTIDVQNLTQGIYFTPLLLVAHTPDASLFEVGESATPELQSMAEGGSVDGLAAIGASINADAVANPAGGLLAPGQATSSSLTTADANTVLSVVAMILPSNDGFIGLDNWTIPTEPGTYTVYLNAYDAGTEANDELRGSGAPGMPGMPVPPPLDPVLGMNGAGVTTMSTNTTVHIHPGNLGDDSLTDGASDVSNTVHRWLNPVAKVTVTVN